ncbi:DUF2955 domain-containing protein [Shewanella sp. ULN5]|uniref:DUF2955 domain-containing protein n=1 Tax=Shewanella sp. ULN5 TaxID=2994678 RepID=UPI00273D9F87|nr:DUF2955 domain-containing protein [Shewanella sp. ULN5]MDP5146624.1 DUF2955 domain-containing protein [Shewanella sp. ULN5]
MSANHLLLDSAQAQRILNRRVLRFALGIGIAIAISAIFSWPLAYIVPVFVAKFLVDRQAPTIQTVYELLIATLVTMAIGWLVSNGPTHYPSVLLPLIAIAMLWAYYLFSDPKWNFFALILIVASIVLPYLAVLHPGASMLVAYGLSLSGVVSVLIFALLHVLLPDFAEQKDQHQRSELDSESREHEAFRALMLAFPIICFFYLLEITGALLTMIMIAILSQQTAGKKSVKVSLFLLITNGVGGLLAIVFYNFLVTVPTLPFYVALSMLCAMIFGYKIYSEPLKSAIYAGIFSTLLVVVASTAASTDADVASNFYVRLAQIFLVGVYMVIASYYLETRNWAFLKKRK